MVGFLRPDPPHPCGDPDCTSANDDHDEPRGLTSRIADALPESVRHGLAMLTLDGKGAE